jgi:ribokinase
MVRIAVVGSLMMDLVVRAPRLVREGESLIAHSLETFVGGKGGNQATAAARLGADVHMIGRVGNDDFGRSILEALRSEGVDTTCVSVDDAEGSGTAIPIVLDDGSNAIYALPRANLRLNASHIDAAREQIAAADMLVVQFETGMDAVIAALTLARAAGVPTLLNPAPIAAHPPETLTLASILVANEVEAAALAPEARGDHEREVRALLDRGPGLVIVTLGELGAVWSDGGPYVSAPPFPVQSVDSVGAGDAFCGALAVALAEGAPHAEAVRFASAAGAIAVTRPGATGALPTRDQISGLL